jgi:hypothetical protein
MLLAIARSGTAGTENPRPKSGREVSAIKQQSSAAGPTLYGPGRPPMFSGAVPQ